ncbi:MAG: glycosyl transferase family 39 [Solirubrobacterales bacterium]|nr:glycosyl transferase family 39 [Solirubrobacterales bacterium]
MTDLSLSDPTRLAAPGVRRLTRAARAVPPELALLLALAAVLNLWALSRNGLANEYYAAAVRSMASSWHDFLYGSLDAAGLQTVDKPPMALWVQALSVRLLGFSSLSMLVPQALMGIASAGLVYDLTRRRFGRFAGFAAGIALATTPIIVAVSRHNNPDALLVLCCTLALWAIVRALEAGRTRWLVLAGACVGLGFETKMAAALLIVPGLAAAYLWVAPTGRWKAIRQLGLGGVAMVVVGGAWPLLVLLTPAADRPWISGTSDNSVLSLVLGYNGLGRLAGQAGGPASLGGGGGGGTSALFGGDAGAFRLLNSALGGQGGWLLGFAVASAVALVVGSRLRRTDARTGWLIAVGGAFAVIAVAFSFASGIFHPYYVSLLAPFTAALVGAGVAQLAAGDRFARIASPLLVAAGVIVEIVVLREYDTLSWLPPVLVVGGIAAALVLTSPILARWRAWVVAAALALMLAAPATWAVQTLGHATSGTFPMGGPQTASVMGGGGGRGGFGGGGPGGGGAPGGTRGAPPQLAGGGTAGGGAGGMFGDASELTSALTYIESHGGGTLGVSSQSTAAAAILSSDAKVAGLGGFSGSESRVSLQWLVQAVRDGRIRWVLTTSGAMGGTSGGRVGATELMAKVAQVGTSTSVSGLYDLQGLADRLAAA